MQDSTAPAPGPPGHRETDKPPATSADDALRADRAERSPPPGTGRVHRFRLGNLRLPTKLLVITILFVMLAEVLVFVPSIASYRLNWLQARIQSARLASLAADASPSGVPAPVRRELLNSAEVRAVAVKVGGMRRLVLPSDSQLVVDATFDLRGMPEDGFWSQISNRLGLISDALYVFVAPADRMIAVYGSVHTNGNKPAASSGDFVEVVLPEAPLRAAMVQHGLNVLGLSIIISIIAAAAVYFTLIKVLVRPMMRFTRNMLYFGENPEDASRIIKPVDRADEIGMAERQLADMQTDLNHLLHQRRRLADLGLAVSKINHDLRNMLSSAQIISDRLGELPDPTVQRFAPKLIASLDRAINFCNDTLRFGRAEEEAPRRALFPLAPLITEVADGLDLPRDGVSLEVNVAPNVQIDADREHLYRVLNNLLRNAVQAIEGRSDPPSGRIVVTAERRARATVIDIEDDGPGVPPRAREHLFKAFQGGTRKGGSGLGLAISAELIRAHGGEIRLMTPQIAASDETGRQAGAHFQIELPDRRPQALDGPSTTEKSKDV